MSLHKEAHSSGYHEKKQSLPWEIVYVMVFRSTYLGAGDLESGDIKIVNAVLGRKREYYKHQASSIIQSTVSSGRVPRSQLIEFLSAHANNAS